MRYERSMLTKLFKICHVDPVVSDAHMLFLDVAVAQALPAVSENWHGCVAAGVLCNNNQESAF